MAPTRGGAGGKAELRPAPGNDALGSEALGSEALGNEALGNVGLASDPPGIDPLGSDGPGRLGNDALGNEVLGNDALGSVVPGLVALGSVALGSCTAGGTEMLGFAPVDGDVLELEPLGSGSMLLGPFAVPLMLGGGKVVGVLTGRALTASAEAGGNGASPEISSEGTDGCVGKGLLMLPLLPLLLFDVPLELFDELDDPALDDPALDEPEELELIGGEGN